MAKLQAIVPSFRVAWDASENVFRGDDGSCTLHSLFAAFGGFVLDRFHLLDEATRIQIFQYVEECASNHPGAGTNLSNAALTCFIENLTNEQLSAKIRPYWGLHSLAYFDAWDNSTEPDAT